MTEETEMKTASIGTGVVYVKPPDLWMEKWGEIGRKQTVEEIAALMVDHDLLPSESLEAQIEEMMGWPTATLEGFRRGIMEKKINSRNISEIAAKNTEAKKEQSTDEEAEWTSEDMIKDFGSNFLKFSCGDDVFEAALANDSIEKLEDMAAQAHRDLLKAKRKFMVLDKAVQKAHALLEQRALEFMEKKSG